VPSLLQPSDEVLQALGHIGRKDTAVEHTSQRRVSRSRVRTHALSPFGDLAEASLRVILHRTIRPRDHGETDLERTVWGRRDGEADIHRRRRFYGTEARINLRSWIHGDLQAWTQIDGALLASAELKNVLVLGLVESMRHIQTRPQLGIRCNI